MKKEVKEVKSQVSVDAALEVLNKDREERSKACTEKLNKVMQPILEEFKCVLDIKLRVDESGKNVMPELVTVAL